jgi:hypothetical protein
MVGELSLHLAVQCIGANHEDGKAKYTDLLQALLRQSRRWHGV